MTETDMIFVNALVPKEDELALRIIGAHMGMNRSEAVRLAICEFIEKHRDVVQVSSLPHPKGGAFVPVITLNPEFLENSKLED